MWTATATTTWSPPTLATRPTASTSATGPGASPSCLAPLGELGVTHTDVDAADLDADGDLDLYFTSPGSFLFNQRLPRRAGSLTSSTTAPGCSRRICRPAFASRVTTSTDSTFGDVDGDGDLDLVVSASGSGPIGDPSGGVDRLYINYSCADDPALCVQIAIDALTELIDALEADDMASSDPDENAERIETMQAQVAAMQNKLNAGNLMQIAPHMDNIARRVDGDGSPPRLGRR